MLLLTSTVIRADNLVKGLMVKFSKYFFLQNKFDNAENKVLAFIFMDIVLSFHIVIDKTFFCITCRYRAHYSKRTKQWRPVALLQPKQYNYIPMLIANVFEEQQKVGSVNQKVMKSAEDPRHISPIISLEPRPSIEHLLQAHKSRF